MYPWLASDYRHLSDLGRKMPSNVLLIGQTGIGKSFLAYELARSLLCPQTGSDASHRGCKCNSCALFSSNNHPDYHVLTTEAVLEKEDMEFMAGGIRYVPEDRRNNPKRRPRQIISIDQVRLLVEELRSGANLGIGKVVAVSPAESLNVNAANALLKILEEPPSQTHFILTSSASNILAPTILSRCTKYRLHIPHDQVIVDWLLTELSCEQSYAEDLLRYVGGSPLEALEVGRFNRNPVDASLQSDLKALVLGALSPIDVSERWLNTPTRITLRWLQRSMLGAIKAGVSDSSIEYPRVIYDQLGPSRCLEIYQEVGEFLLWPPQSIDERLFINRLAVKLVRPSTTSAIELSPP